MKRPASSRTISSGFVAGARSVPRSHDPLDLHHRLPGETDEDFENVVAVSRRSNGWTGWAHSHIFAGRGRRGNELPGAVPDEGPGKRQRQLMEFPEDISAAPRKFHRPRDDVLVDEIDDDGGARSPADAPEIDGLVNVPRATGSGGVFDVEPGV